MKALQRQSAGSLFEESENSGRGTSFRPTRLAGATSEFTSRFIGESSIAASKPGTPSLVAGSLQGASPLLSRVGRTQRRAQRYQLDEAPRMGGEETAGKGLGEGLLGSHRITFEEDENEKTAALLPRKEERFREVLQTSKQFKAARQKERADRDAATVALDEEFKVLQHLLTKRDTREEDRKAFEKSGTPEVRALLQAYKQRRGKLGRVLVVRSAKSEAEGETSYTVPAEPKEGNKAEMDALNRLRLETLHKLGESASGEEGDEDAMKRVEVLLQGEEEEGEAAPEGQRLDETDAFDFDRSMYQMMADPRRARATKPLLTEEAVEALEAERLRLAEDRAAVPELGALEAEEQIQRTRREWVERGGDQAFQMAGGEESDDGISVSSLDESENENENEEGKESKEEVRTSQLTGGSLSGSPALDRLLVSLEALAETPVDAVFRASYQHLLQQFYRLGQHHNLALVKTFRTVLIEAERLSLRGRLPGKALLISLLLCIELFPLTDYRHPVSSPLLLYLSSAVFQVRVQGREEAKGLLLFAALLTRCVSLVGGAKFLPEAVTAVLNVLALQVPLRRLCREGSRYQGVLVDFPLVERTGAAVDTPLLSSTGVSKPASDGVAIEQEVQVKSVVHLLSLAADKTRAKAVLSEEAALAEDEELLLGGYGLLLQLAEAYQGIAAFPALLRDPFESLHRLMLLNEKTDSFVWQPSPLIAHQHAKVRARLEALAAAQVAQRTPLAMRTFRPRPLRQFDPLLEEREEIAVKSEIRELKKTVREDRKRVLRHVQAEAVVTRRKREGEEAAREAVRTKAYNRVLGQLQAQQHVMKTVDAAMERGRKNVRKGLSGAPKESQGMPEE